MDFALQPAYDIPTDANVPFDLCKGEMTLSQGEGRLTGLGVVRFEFLPKPRIVLDLVHSGLSVGGVEVGKRADLRAPGIDVPVPAFIVGTHHRNRHPGESIRVTGVIEDFEHGESAKLSRIIAHVINFRETRGSFVTDQNGDGFEGFNFRDARTILEFDGWIATIDRMKTSKSTDKQLKASGGFAVTDLIQLERADGRTFPADEARRVLSFHIPQFLTFCRGASVGTALWVGYSPEGGPAWWRWDAGKADRWHNVESWVSELEPHVLARCFPGYWRLANDPTWGEPLWSSLHWYVEANKQAGAIEGAIVLAQAAFELLAWTRLVKDLKSLSDSEFNNLKPASARLASLLTSCGLPLDIPEQLGTLTSAARENGWANGPGTLTKIRNNIVHPKPIGRSPASARIQAWQLSVWYLELILLRLFDYDGIYMNRLFQSADLGDDCEPVPWAPPSQVDPSGVPWTT